MRAIESTGVGVGGARSISGTQTPALELEQRLATFKGVDAAMLLSSGFLANLAVVPALVGKGDVIFSDALNHASIVDGCRLSGAEIVRYPTPTSTLCALLLDAHPTSGKRIMVTDGVFSMEGDLAPLDRIAEVATAARAMLVVDDAHGEGVLGRGGRGIVDHFGVRDAVTAEIGTLSKAFGVGRWLCVRLGRCARTAAAARRARICTRLACRQPTRPPHWLASSAHRVRRSRPPPVGQHPRVPRRAQRPRRCGHSAKGRSCPWCWVTKRVRAAVAERLFEAGVFVVPIAYPMVPRGQARIRVMISAAHSAADLESAAHAIAAAVGGT